jgi:hypothetical protein
MEGRRDMQSTPRTMAEGRCHGYRGRFGYALEINGEKPWHGKTMAKPPLPRSNSLELLKLGTVATVAYINI